MDEEGWVHQHGRIKRWRERVLNLYQEPRPDLFLFQDYVFAFFISCYHLCDWIDEGKEKHGAKTFAHNDYYLAICRDICNGAKHFDIRKRSKGRHPRMAIKAPDAMLTMDTGGHSDMAIFPEAPPDPDEKIRCYFTTDTEEIELEDMMNKCVESWDRFIQLQGLGVPAADLPWM